MAKSIVLNVITVDASRALRTGCALYRRANIHFFNEVKY